MRKNGGSVLEYKVGVKNASVSGDDGRAGIQIVMIIVYAVK